MDMPLPEWMSRWCRTELGSDPAERLSFTNQMSEVIGVRLEDGRRIVIKSRPDPEGRTVTCLAVQRILADRGFPCAKPLTAISFINGLAVHAEEWHPEGEMLRQDDTAAAVKFARLYRELMAITETIELPPPLPNPEWVHWDHQGSGFWAPNARHDARAAIVKLPDKLIATAARARARLTAGADLRRVIGHADWETQNLRWHGAGPAVVYDWDSLAWLPEAALVGAASGTFASAKTPTLAPLRSSGAFLSHYEQERGRRFSAEERELAWAASLWPALHNARIEILYGRPQVAYTALMAQSDERLRLAGG